MTAEPNGPVLAAVAALRQIGFFADRAGPDPIVTGDLVAEYRGMWGRVPDARDPLLDLELLRFDPDRVWWEDTEQDVAPLNDAYVEAIQGWAAISRGAFEPTRVEERWDTPRGPVRINLTHAGQSRELVARYLDDYLDLAVLGQLNDIITDGPYRFRVHAPFDQTAFVIACTDDERQRLEARGWRFAGPDDGGIEITSGLPQPR
jgi:hypothetical protein